MFQHSDSIVLRQSRSKVVPGRSSFELKMLISRSESKIRKIVPGITRVIHRDASIGRLFVGPKNKNRTEYKFLGYLFKESILDRTDTVF